MATSLKGYILLTKEQVKDMKAGNSFVTAAEIQGNIDLKKLITDRRYKSFLEKSLLQSII